MTENPLLARLQGGRIVELCWANVDDESTDRSLQLSVVTTGGDRVAVEIRADHRFGDPVLSIFEKAEWTEDGGDGA